MPANKYSPNWQQAVIPCGATLRQALTSINESGLLLSCFLNDAGRPIAILTDSDIRRALLNGATLETRAYDWANRNPIVAPATSGPELLAQLASEFTVYEVPLVDPQGRLSDIYVVNLTPVRRLPPAAPSKSLPNSMLILAGGLGLRLRSMVSDRPKPLAVVGSQPILATLIQRAASGGIHNFYISVNYMAEKVEEHLKDPVYAGLNIQVLRETQPLGTAGSIGLIPEKLEEPLLVWNADVLTTATCPSLLQHHKKESADITCAVYSYENTVPYGVFEIANNRIVGMQDSIHTRYLVNAGIYVLDPKVCALVKRNEKIDMPALIHRVLAGNKRVSPFLLHEYWIDIGQPLEYQKANQDYEKLFATG